MDTVYGKFWKFSSASLDFADTAYTSEALGPHTDSTYYTNTPGVQVRRIFRNGYRFKSTDVCLQVFHLLDHSSGSGGETVLVDGFYCANMLQKQRFADTYLYIF